MNDRIYTILDRFGLRPKMLESYEAERLEKAINHSIDWESVAKIQGEMQATALSYFSDILVN
jgi:hypothetical protein